MNGRRYSGFILRLLRRFDGVLRVALLLACPTSPRTGCIALATTRPSVFRFSYPHQVPRAHTTTHFSLLSLMHGRNSWQMAEELKPLMMELDKDIPVITSHSLVGMTAVACGFK